MTTIKRIMSWTLMAAMVMGTFIPVENVQAGQNAEVMVYGEDGSVSSENPGDTGTEQTGSEESSTEDTTTEQPKTEQPTTEQPATEEPVTEPVQSEYTDTGLSPAKAKVVVLDPGHCNKHPGASGNGLREEAVNLDIALACRDYLQDYADVIVYMTREDGSCCVDLGVGDCLASRNNYAKLLNADFLVSMHINAGSSTGANVLAAYKSGYNDSIRKKTQAFGKIALAKLKELGIANRGLLLRKSGSGNRYSNGKLADYYSIVRLGVVQKLPSVIIEHGYITSSSDCSKFFKTKAKRQKVGKADAKAIVEYYGLKQKLITGTFRQEQQDTYFTGKDGTKLAGWVKEDGKWYYFDTMTGKMQKGFVTIGEDTFYLSPNTGEMVTGWFTYNNASYLAGGNGVLVRGKTHSDGRYTYLFNDAGKQLKKGFHTVNGAVYYVNAKKRVVVNGIQKISGKYYGFDEDGKKLFGYQKLNGKYYYFDSETGVMSKNKMVTIDDEVYYFGAKGTQVTGWVTYKKNKYYFDKSTGKMVTGWKKISGKYYYFHKKTGKMQKSKWIGKYYVNSKGIRTKKK